MCKRIKIQEEIWLMKLMTKRKRKSIVQHGRLSYRHEHRMDVRCASSTYPDTTNRSSWVAAVRTWRLVDPLSGFREEFLLFTTQDAYPNGLKSVRDLIGERFHKKNIVGVAVVNENVNANIQMNTKKIRKMMEENRTEITERKYLLHLQILKPFRRTHGADNLDSRGRRRRRQQQTAKARKVDDDAKKNTEQKWGENSLTSVENPGQEE